MEKITKNNRYYLFDWDNNIMNMPTKIILDKKDGDRWKKVLVSTERFSKIRKDIPIKYRLREDSFIKFSKNKYFIEDLKKSILEKNVGPSFHKFIEAILYKNDFAIITARGHSINTIKKGIIILIENLFPDAKKVFESDLSLEDYLNKQKYYPINSNEFNKKFKSIGSAYSPEEGKKLALNDYIKHITKNNVSSDEIGINISIGFSDDDIKNIKHIEKYIREDLKKRYKNIHFVVYNTSNPKKIEKKRMSKKY